MLQAGSKVAVRYRARMADQLGSASLEAMGEGLSALFDDPLALAGLSSAAAVAAGALPEREAHPGAFNAFEALTHAFGLTVDWPEQLRWMEALHRELSDLPEIRTEDVIACVRSGRIAPPPQPREDVEQLSFGKKAG